MKLTRWGWLIIIVVLVLLSSTVLAAKLYQERGEESSPFGEPSTNCKPGYPCAVIEDQGKISVSNTPEVQALAQKYGWPHIHINAVDIEVVKDLEFVRSIYPDFKEEMGCIIIVHAGENEGYVYQEDKNLNIIHRESLQEFMRRTSSVDSSILAKFYLSLH